MEILLGIVIGIIIVFCFKDKKHTTQNSEFMSYSDYTNHIDNIVKVQMRNDEYVRYEQKKFKPFRFKDLNSWKPYLNDMHNIITKFQSDGNEILCKNGLFGILIDPLRQSITIRVDNKNTNEKVEYFFVTGYINEYLSASETLDILKELYKNYYGEEYKS